MGSMQETTSWSLMNKDAMVFMIASVRATFVELDCHSG